MRHLFIKNSEYAFGQHPSLWSPRGEEVANARWQRLVESLPAPICGWRPLADFLLPIHCLPIEEQPVGPWVKPVDVSRLLKRHCGVTFYAPNYKGRMCTSRAGYKGSAGNGGYIVYGLPTSHTHEHLPIDPGTIDPSRHRVRKLTPFELATVNGVPEAVAAHISACQRDNSNNKLGDMGQMQQPVIESELVQSFGRACGLLGTHDCQGNTIKGAFRLFKKGSVHTSHGPVDIFRWQIKH